MRGTRIETLSDLACCAALKRSVVGFGNLKPLPAAVVINWPGSVLVKIFANGLWVYVKPARTRAERKRDSRIRKSRAELERMTAFPPRRDLGSSPVLHGQTNTRTG